MGRSPWNFKQWDMTEHSLLTFVGFLIILNVHGGKIKTSRKSSLYPTGIKFMARAFLFSMVQNKGKKVCLWDN